MGYIVNRLLSCFGWGGFRTPPPQHKSTPRGDAPPDGWDLTVSNAQFTHPRCASLFWHHQRLLEHARAPIDSLSTNCFCGTSPHFCTFCMDGTCINITAGSSFAFSAVFCNCGPIEYCDDEWTNERADGKRAEERRNERSDRQPGRCETDG